MVGMRARPVRTYMHGRDGRGWETTTPAVAGALAAQRRAPTFAPRARIKDACLLVTPEPSRALARVYDALPILSHVAAFVHRASRTPALFVSRFRALA